jgi:hypothetical protein
MLLPPRLFKNLFNTMGIHECQAWSGPCTRPSINTAKERALGETQTTGWDVQAFISKQATKTT